MWRSSLTTSPPIVAESDLILTAPTLVLRKLLTERMVLIPAPITPPPAFRHLDLIWHDRLGRHPARDWMLAAIRCAAEMAQGPL
jgi:DNA-binding transcriptional LysR family regulator